MNKIFEEYLKDYKEKSYETIRNMKYYFDNEDDLWWIIEELLDRYTNQEERIDKAIELEEEIMYLANKVVITTQNVEVKAVRDRLGNLFDVLKGEENEN